jgi:hypothetical protein
MSMPKNELPSTDLNSLNQAAITHERMLNPFCPVADIINEALQMGDLEMANKIALESLKPKVRIPLKERLKSIFKR